MNFAGSGEFAGPVGHSLSSFDKLWGEQSGRSLLTPSALALLAEFS